MSGGCRSAETRRSARTGAGSAETGRVGEPERTPQRLSPPEPFAAPGSALLLPPSAEAEAPGTLPFPVGSTGAGRWARSAARSCPTTLPASRSPARPAGRPCAGVSRAGAARRGQAPAGFLRCSCPRPRGAGSAGPAAPGGLRGGASLGSASALGRAGPRGAGGRRRPGRVCRPGQPVPPLRWQRSGEDGSSAQREARGEEPVCFLLRTPRLFASEWWRSISASTEALSCLPGKPEECPSVRNGVIISPPVKNVSGLPFRKPAGFALQRRDVFVNSPRTRVALLVCIFSVFVLYRLACFSLCA